ncbi:MAG: hypothetical protein NVSMB1_08420 [Polyangiales bacterium]
MRKTSIVHAKAHFSELIDLAEHKGLRIIVCRHGKPAAAIVPVDVAKAVLERARPRVYSRREIAALFEGLGVGDGSKGGVEALHDERSRLDRVHR